MSNNPWFPLWVGDFISDTAHLSDAETGQYLLILMCLWRNGGELPDDPAKLARIARVSRYRRVSSEVMKFFKRKNGTITQKRLSQEIEKARQFSKSQSEKAKLRWAPKSLENNETADAQAMPSHSQSQSHSRSITGESEYTTSEFRESFWPMYPNKVGKPYALKCFLAARKRAALATILGGLKLYIETKPPDRQWCNPSTWLNQDRWDDKPAPIATKRSKTMEIAEKLMREANGTSKSNGRHYGGEHLGGKLSLPSPRAGDLHAPSGGLHGRKAEGTG